MFRISSQQPQVAAPTSTASSAQGAPSSATQFQNLLASLEQAIQQLARQYGGGARPGGGGGDHMEQPARTGPVARPTQPVHTRPADPRTTDPRTTTPEDRSSPPFSKFPFPRWDGTPRDIPGGGHGWGAAMGACGSGEPEKGPSGGTLTRFQ